MAPCSGVQHLRLGRDDNCGSLSSLRVEYEEISKWRAGQLGSQEGRVVIKGEKPSHTTFTKGLSSRASHDFFDYVTSPKLTILNTSLLPEI